jgi:hypothetical protein
MGEKVADMLYWDNLFVYLLNFGAKSSPTISRREMIVYKVMKWELARETKVLVEILPVTAQAMARPTFIFGDTQFKNIYDFLCVTL